MRTRGSWDAGDSYMSHAGGMYNTVPRSTPEVEQAQQLNDSLSPSTPDNSVDLTSLQTAILAKVAETQDEVDVLKAKISDISTTLEVLDREVALTHQGPLDPGAPRVERMVTVLEAKKSGFKRELDIASETSESLKVTLEVLNEYVN